MLDLLARYFPDPIINGQPPRMEDNRSLKMGEDGNWDGELVGKDWAEFPVQENGYNGEDIRIQDLYKNGSFLRAGGRLVIGEHWKSEGEDSRIPRVYFSYHDYSRFTKELAKKIQDSGQNYDAVVTMPKGGVAIGAHIANTLRKPLGYFHANSYGTKEKGGDMQFGNFNTGSGFPKGNISGEGKKPRILLVDDLADTGKTFLAVKKELEARGYEVDTAAIFHKANPGVETPTHCLFENYPPLWIVQPTEGHMEGGPTKEHNVGGINEHRVTHKMREIADRINQFLGTLQDNTEGIRTIRIHLPQAVSEFQAMIAIGTARLIDTQYSVEFVPKNSRTTKNEIVPGVSFVITSDALELSPTGHVEVPVIIARYEDDSYGILEGHDARGIDTDTDTEGAISSTAKVHKCFATKGEIFQLGVLSKTYGVNGADQEKYKDICRGILARPFFQ